MRTSLSFSLGALGALVGGSALYSYGTSFQKSVIIKNKYIRVHGNKDNVSQVFMICDDQNKHYKVGKSIWYWQMYAPELWSSFKEGDEYDIKGYGWRFGLLSIYPNVYSADKCNHNQKN